MRVKHDAACLVHARMASTSLAVPNRRIIRFLL